MYVVMFMMAEGNHLAAEKRQATWLQFSRDRTHSSVFILWSNAFVKLRLDDFAAVRRDNHEDRPGRNKFTISLISL